MPISRVFFLLLLVWHYCCRLIPCVFVLFIKPDNQQHKDCNESYNCNDNDDIEKRVIDRLSGASIWLSDLTSRIVASDLVTDILVSEIEVTGNSRIGSDSHISFLRQVDINGISDS